MWFGVITLFPEMFSILQHGITGRALKNELIKVACWNPRDYTHNKHRSVDDRPYGGGPGMIMMAQPLQEAITAARKAALLSLNQPVFNATNTFLQTLNSAFACSI